MIDKRIYIEGLRACLSYEEAKTIHGLIKSKGEEFVYSSDFDGNYPRDSFYSFSESKRYFSFFSDRHILIWGSGGDNANGPLLTYNEMYSILTNSNNNSDLIKLSPQSKVKKIKVLDF